MIPILLALEKVFLGWIFWLYSVKVRFIFTSWSLTNPPTHLWCSELLYLWGNTLIGYECCETPQFEDSIRLQFCYFGQGPTPLCLPSYRSEAAEGTWSWEGTDDGAYVSMRTLGESGACSPPNFLFKVLWDRFWGNVCTQIKTVPTLNLSCASLWQNCSGIAEPSLHVFPLYMVRFKSGQKADSLKGGALKGKLLPRGGYVPLVPLRFRRLCRWMLMSFIQ